jgi:serine protease Do
MHDSIRQNTPLGIVLLMAVLLVLQFAILVGSCALPSSTKDAEKATATRLDAPLPPGEATVPGAGTRDIRLTSCSTEDLGVAVARVRTAVVYITGKRTPVHQLAAQPPTPASTTGDRMGSGVVFDADGYILTNYHVIADVSDIVVRTFAERETAYSAEVVAVDREDDLAILKAEVPHALPVAKFGNSDMLEVGEELLAIGCPFNMEQSVTHGIVSDTKRTVSIDGRTYNDLIQTDAAINSGNSGGALIDTEGSVVGINVAIYAPSRVFCGVGFAIPINRAKLFMLKAQYLRDTRG